MLKSKKSLILFTSLILWMMFITLGYVTFDVCDDTNINFIAAGVLGSGRQYLIYSNILLGYLLSFLFSVFTHINCYLWFYLVMDLVAVVLICLVITESMELKAAVVTTVGMNLLFASEFYVHITYTKSAALYGIVGLIALFWQVKKDKKDKGLFILSFVLIAFGLWARWKAFMLGVPIIVGVELIDILFQTTSKKKVDFKRYFPVLIAMVICVASLAIDSLAYKLNDGWDEFRKDDNLLIEMRDNNRYSFSDAPEEYLEAGFSEIDFTMIKGYRMFNDPLHFNSTRLQQLKDIGVKYEPSTIRFEVSLIKGTIKELLWISTSKSFGVIFVILLLLGLALGDRALLAKFFYLIVCAVGEIYYMFCLNRVLWEVEICVALSIVLTGAYIVVDKVFRKQESVKNKKDYTLYVFVAVIIAFIAAKSLIVDNTRFTNGDSRYEEFKTLTETDAFFIVQDIDNYGMLLGAEDIFDITYANYKDYYSNIVDIGGTSQSPAGMYFARLNGITNPIKDLINTDGYYYVGQDEDARQVVETYMNEKYGPGIEWEAVKVGDVQAYKVVKK